MTVYQAAEELVLVHSGDDFFNRLEQLLDGARERIHFHTYIFQADATGQRVADALVRAAARGVRVQLLVDGYGSQDLPQYFIQDLRKAGVEFRFFDPFMSFWQRNFGRTLHHKVVVADANQALIGGINIADKYRGSDTEPPWLDFAVLIRGEVCREMSDLCERIFAHDFWKKKRKKSNPKATPDHTQKPGNLLRFRQNDWLRRKTEIYQSYRSGILSARSELIIVASYFLPGRELRRHLAAAAKRGVAIKILLTGPSDVQLSRLAEQYLSDWLLRKGIRVFRWEKSVLHGKAILVDQRWASLGSYNVNRLSRFRSVELNVDILAPRFIQQFNQYLNQLLGTECTEVTPLSLPYFTSPWQRLKSRLAYHLAVYLMRVLFPEKR
ncbi:MAG: hypothetical protein IT260_17475 [Saprospiraceae bacterium]|nr:hypothetical protein [Saprospiraceae bacterium]